MRRYAALIVALILVLPLVAESTGTLTIPVTFGSLPAGQQNLSLFDVVNQAIANYVNQREISFDTTANRPTAGTHGRTYFATDTNTIYDDTGTTWTTIASVVGQADALTGLTLSNPSAASGTTDNIEAGAASSDDATINNRVLMQLGTFAKTTASWTLGTGNGCLDTGTVAASTWYSVFVIERIDTAVVDVLCSTSATAPTMPTNYTRKRRIGSILTDANTAINYFTQFGDEVIWATPSALNVNEVAEDTLAHTATATTPNGVITQAILHAAVYNTANPRVTLYISALASADVAPSATASPLGSVTTAVNSAS